MFARVVAGDGGEVGFGDFEVVAEDGVVADFEGLDAGAGDFAVLQVGDPAAAFGPGAAELIEIRVMPLADHASFACGGRRIVDHGGFKEVDQWIEGEEAGCEAEKRGVVVFGEGGAEGREEGEGSFQRDKVTRVAGGHAQAGNSALHITDIAENVAHRGEARRIIVEAGHKVLAVRDHGKIAQRMKDPFAQEA